MTRRFGAVLLGIILFVGMSLPAHPAAPPREVKKDHYGDALPPGAVARLGTLRYRVPYAHSPGLGFTADGKHLVASSYHTVEVVEAKTGRTVRSIRLDFQAEGFALSRDGQLAAVAGFRRHQRRDSEGVVRIVRVADGKEVRTWLRQKESHSYWRLAFSADGKRLASLNGDGLFRLEEIRGGEELLRHRFARGYLVGLAFSPDGDTLAAATDSKVYTWRWKDGVEPTELKVPRWSVSSLAFSHDGKTLALGSDRDDGVRLWDVATGKPKQVLQRGRRMMRFVCFSPDGKYLAASSYNDRETLIYDAKTGKEVRRLAGQGREAAHLVFSPDSGRLAALEDGVLRLWDVESGKDLAEVASHDRSPNFVRLLKDDVAITASDDGTVRFWDARTGTQTKRIDVAREYLRGAAVSPDGRWLAASQLGENHSVSLWDLKTGKRVYRLAGHGRYGGNRALAFTTDSKRLASWGDDQYLRLWDVAKGKAIEEHAIKPDGKGGPMDDADPAGRLDWAERLFFMKPGLSADAALFALSFDDHIYVFDVASGKQKVKMKNEDSRITGLAFSPDNKALLAAAEGKGRLENLPGGGQRVVNDGHAITLFDLASGTVRKRITFPDDSLHHVAYRPDGKGFAVAFTSPKPLVRFFDADGKQTGKIDLPSRPWVLAYSSDGKRLIVSQPDTTALIYDVPTR